MKLFYLVRRIVPTGNNNSHTPNFQIVFCDKDHDKVEQHLSLIHNEAKLKQPFCTYSIEYHDDTISGKELERRYLNKLRNENQNVTVTNSKPKPWVHNDDSITLDHETESNFQQSDWDTVVAA